MNYYKALVIEKINNGGYNVDVQIDGTHKKYFMPTNLIGVNKLVNPDDYIGKEIIVMLDGKVASRKKYLESILNIKIKDLKIYDEYSNRILYSGIVINKTYYGIFIEFDDCLTTMLHKNVMCDEYKNNYENIKIGDTVIFYISEVIKNKIYSTQIDTEKINIKVKQTFKNKKVVQKISHGYLVELYPTFNGLIHESEVNKKINIGDNLNVKVIGYNKKNREVFLKPF